MTFIQENKYREIIDYVPITCIDFFIIKNNKVLLWKRKNKPYKWEWFVPWWRINKLETQQNVLQRKLKQETWIDLSRMEEININPDNQNETLDWFKIKISDKFCEYTNMLIWEYINYST